MRGNVELIAFNRGLISRLAMARVDLKRTALSAEIQTNWMPRALGSMMLRPGLGYTGQTAGNLRAKYLDFVFSAADTALIELTNGALRVWVDDALIARPAVTAAITNGSFAADLTGWTDEDGSGAASEWVAGGYLGLTGTGSNAATRRQLVTALEPGVLHALRINVTSGPITMRCGSTAGGDDYVRAASLLPGEHSIAFTPAGDFYIEFSNTSRNQALLESVQIEGAGVMSVAAPWLEGDLRLVRWDQSGDVLFVACVGYQQRRIERRANGSWSVVLYQAADGPFRVDNVGSTTITPSALTGNITLTASAPLFRAGQVGGLMRITSSGQRVEDVISGDGVFSDSIRVTGITTSRSFIVDIAGDIIGTVTLQRSVGDEGSWEDVKSYTTLPTSDSYSDGLDNQIIFYRLGIKTGDYTSGDAEVKLTYTLGSITGVVRITSVTDETEANAEVLTALGNTTASDFWAEGAWSPLRGWPSAVALHDGRLWWAGKDRFWGSISDAFDSFDDTFEGDAGPISRSIGSGPVDTINWLAAMKRLIAGADGSEIVCRSSSLDEPLTPTNFNPKPASRQGSASVAAVKVDDDAIFVQRCGYRVYQMTYSAEKYDYVPDDLSAVVPEIGRPGIVSMAVQRQPDTRVHCIRADGKAAVLVYDATENVRCWVMVETDGIIEDAVVLPGPDEDQVYYLVQRNINGAVVRNLERWALESEAHGGIVNKLADAFAVYSGAPTTSLAGFSHLNGESVAVWADGKDVGMHTVAGGVITLATAASYVVAGLPYQASYKSTKLAYLAQFGTALTQRKRVNGLGLILADTHAQGLRYGPSLDRLDDLPSTEYEAAVDPDMIWDQYDADSFSFNGDWNTDSRICLVAASPRPATVLAMVFTMETKEK